MEICKDLDLRFLNGRLKGDSLGRITFNGHQGFSTVDYFIVSHELLKSFAGFIVKTPTPLSDHSQLICWLNVTPSMQHDQNLDRGSLHSLPVQFAWKDDSKEKIY